MPAPLPVHEPERINFLCSLNVLDTEPEKRFDDITRLCCMIFKTPIALVSLVDKDRQWFKSVVGLDVRQTERKAAFCAWTLLPQYPEVLVVENALEDIRFRNNPLVLGPPNIRFYTGCPLVATNKQRLGSLCIIDNKPRVFDAESCNMLANMAEMVVREIEKDQMLEQQKIKASMLSAENTQLIRALDCFSEGIMLLNLSLPTWPVLFVNEAWERATGLHKDDSSGLAFWDIFQAADGGTTKSRKHYASAIEQQQTFDLTVVLSQGGTRKYLRLQFRCAHSQTMDSYMPLVGIPSNLSAAPSQVGPVYYFATIVTAPRLSMELSHTSKAGGDTFTIINTKVDPFDDVKLGPLLGKGGYGRVYRGIWNGAQVAVKVLETIKEGDSEEVLEAVLGAKIAHPNIVQTYKHCSRPMGQAHDADNEGKAILETWMVMDFCNKGSLSDAVERGWLRNRHSLFEVNYKALVLTAREVASAMVYLHGRNILHGDLTGNNVLLASSDKDERHWLAKVADFGLSRVMAGDTITTASYGTITHMPPELLVDGHLSKACDVYGYGVIVWEMYSGQRPFGGLTHGQILHAVSTGKMLSISPSCPSPLKAFLQKCMAPKADDRPTFQQIIPMLDDLESELVGE